MIVTRFAPWCLDARRAGTVVGKRRMTRLVRDGHTRGPRCKIAKNCTYRLIMPSGHAFLNYTLSRLWGVQIEPYQNPLPTLSGHPPWVTLTRSALTPSSRSQSVI